MEKRDADAERVFAQALELPSGALRDAFVASHCNGNAALLQEVTSLLAAHDQAGNFLLCLAEKQPKPGSPDAATRGETTGKAAALAEEFLRRHATSSPPAMEAFLAAQPESLRREIGERIYAGLRIRAGQVGDAREPSAEIPPLPPQLPGFRIECPLGRGSLGVVYAAHDEKLNRSVAIKVLRRGTDPSVGRCILDEARKAAALTHPAVVTIYSVLDDTDPPAIVMERVEGFPLDQFAAQLSMEQKARLLREVAGGLAAAHERGLVHRDLKPENIIVGPDLRPRILDFGLALSAPEAQNRKGGFEGTPLYASPEQVQGKPLTSASDIFSFGSLMFKVLTGRAPFGGKTSAEVLEAIATTAPPFLREVAAGIPEDLQAICLACLAWSEEDRPPAAEIAVELGRYLVGEPVRLKPKLYDDLLRQTISEYSTRANAWESQRIISREEHDALAVVHRRLLADEDHWIIDARKITLLQTVLSAATWLTVVATILTVWMLRDDLGSGGRWAVPAYFTASLFAAGYAARRTRETAAAATFLAGATLAVAPCLLALLAELHILADRPAGVTQLFSNTFTNQQTCAAAALALGVSLFSLMRLKMTGFAWTTAALTAVSYLAALLTLNWLNQKPEIKALWCLPLTAMEPVALWLERRGRVRWTMPFHLVALIALVLGLDIIAWNGPTLAMIGVSREHWPYFDEGRQQAFSFVLNGLFFLALMLATERSASLDLRRASKWLEVLALVHTLSALFANALSHRADAHVRADVWLYLGAAAAFMILAPFRSRWRLLVGGLLGCGLGSYLLVDLGIVSRKPFIIGLGLAGLLTAVATLAYVHRRSSRGDSK